jgi:hypothetical protein
MNVELAEERILVLTDRFSMELAEGRAWTRKLEAFGTMAALGGFLSKPKDEEFETVYRERRLQPFWRLVSTATYTYERRRAHAVSVAPEVTAVELCGQTHAAVGGKITVEGLEHCHEERRREVFIDALTGAAHPEYAAYLDFAAVETTPEALVAMATETTVVAPPQTRGSMLVRDAIAQAITKIDADKVLEETVRLEAVDLFYRPVYAFRYRRLAKEAVVEFDALTGAIKATGGSTFEQHLGKVMDPKFLLDISAEAANLFIPGATVAKIAIVKGLEMRERAKNTPPH